MPTKKIPYYITTPIYYPSDSLHIGHCYTTVCCDALARFKRLSGFDVFYLTGTDEHGQKIEEKAKQAGKTPKAFVDDIVKNIKDLWKLMGISYDGYIRTTDKKHKAAVQKIFTTLYEKGDIYKSTYRGRYCTPCESYWTPSQSKDGKCPECGRETVESEEECYFFRLSKYEKPLLDLLQNTDYLEPKSRVNEMVNSFLKGGLEDLAVSRSSFSWGVPVPHDKKHTVYVWIDALTNYITALGYGSENDTNFQKYWPADCHMMAREIVRFHSIIWPALLMALDIPLPKKVFGHGWLLIEGTKMSKSLGNVIDPFVLCDRYSVDAIRYYLLRELSGGQDGEFNAENMLTRINADLCNDLGNLVKRTTAMAKQYFEGKVVKPKAGEGTEFDGTLQKKMDGLFNAVSQRMDKLEISKSLEVLFELISESNKYIDLTKPWILNKEGKKKELNAVLYHLLEAIRIATTMLLPYIQNAPKKIFELLGIKEPKDFKDMLYGKIKSYTTKEGDALFVRLVIKKELEELEAAKAGGETKITASQIKNDTETVGAVTNRPQQNNKETNMITIDEFFKTELKVAEVKACEKVEKADKLLKLTLDVGGEERTVVSGIALSYTPEEMVGKKVVLVYNLAPAKLRGIESQGMILCAVQDDKPIIVSPESFVDNGGIVR